jgi:1-deoxy-D-xylulose 5-phosphate reductoisomerase
VAAFLGGRIGFTAIPDLICRAMDAYEHRGATEVRDLTDVRAIDGWARDFAEDASGGVQSKIQVRGQS